MADGVLGPPGPIVQGHVEQEFRVQRDNAVTQSKSETQFVAVLFSVFCVLFKVLKLLQGYLWK